MRILHVTDVYRPRVGGIEMFVEELARRQAVAGHDVSVLSLTPPAPGAHGADPVDVGSRAEEVDQEITVLRKPSRSPFPLPFLPRRRIADVSSYDVVHAHLSVVSPFSTRVLQAAVGLGIPTVATVHSMWNGREGWIRIVGAIAGWDRWPVQWTAVSSAAAEDLRVCLGSHTPVRVVPNAVEVEWWRALAPVTDHSRPVTVVAVMRLAGRKRPLQLVDALVRARAAASHQPVRAVIVGEGPLEERVRQHVADLGASDWVELVGHRSREAIRELYSRADVYVAPSHQESFGLAALEARAAGLPVVAMRSGGVGEFVRHGYEGLLCHDDEDMARALTMLITDEELRVGIARHNRALAPVHDWAQTMQGFESSYAGAAQAVGARRRARA